MVLPTSIFPTKLFAQDKLIKNDGDTILVSIKKVTDQNISFTYLNETILYELDKKNFIKILFNSGRSEVLNSETEKKSKQQNLSFTDKITLTVGFVYIGAIVEINNEGVVFIKQGTYKELNIPKINISQIEKNGVILTDDEYNKLKENKGSEQNQSNQNVYYKPKVYKKYNNLIINQVERIEGGTMVYFTYSNVSYNTIKLNISDNIYLVDLQTSKRANLQTCINISRENRVSLLKPMEELNFILVFDAISVNCNLLEIINPNGGQFNIGKIELVKNNFPLNSIDFVTKTPVMEYGEYYKNGQIIKYYLHNGLFISAAISIEKQYGKYFSVYLFIENFTGKEILMDPNFISSSIKNYKGDEYQANTLTYEQYLKIVKNNQFFENFALAFVTTLETMNAGYSSSSTIEHSRSSANNSVFASGFTDFSYFSYLGYGSYNSSKITVSHTTTYNASEAYMTRRASKADMEKQVQKQYQIKKMINEGYLKKNTIFNSEQYIGYLNIEYINRSSNVEVTIPLLDNNYVFTWGIQ